MGVCSLLTAFHLAGTVQYGFALWYLFNVFSIPKTDQFKMFHTFGGELRFLTNWNLIVQAVFFTICLLNDLFGSNEIKPKQTPLIRKLKDFIHATIGFPVGLFVAGTFWGLYAIDRELVFPKVIDPFFPSWLNHIMHTNVAIFTIIELICAFRVYPKRKSGILAHTLFLSAYLTWTLIIYAISGRWVYPILNILNWPQRICFIVGMVVMSLAFYMFGETLNRLIWSKELKLVESSSASSKKKATKQT